MPPCKDSNTYYGIPTAELIDNDLITIDKGIFYLYGMAKVNIRVVCICLLSLEFTNYHFNIEGFTGTLYRCLSGLYFFYKQFQTRIEKKATDLQHEKYLAIRSGSRGLPPFPAIFSVKSELDINERVEISFQRSINKTSDGQSPYILKAWCLPC